MQKEVRNSYLKQGLFLSFQFKMKETYRYGLINNRFQW